MKKSSLVLSCFSLLVASSVFAAEYKIDTAHSIVGFKTKHMMVGKVTGKFNKFEGTIQFDPSKVEESKINAVVDMASVDTNEPKRDAHLKSDDFFSVSKFPKMKFVSTKVKKDSDKKFMMEGDLTLHGVTKNVKFDVEYSGEGKDPYGNMRAGFEARGMINRKDFGILWNKTMDGGGLVVSDEVEIMIDVEAIQAPAKK